MKKLFTATLFALCVVLTIPAFADGHSTLRAVVVQTDDVDAYVAQLREGNRIMKEMNAGFTMRAYRATFAGDRTGTVVVALEYPGGMSDFGAAWEKVLENEEMNSWLAGLSGMRTIVSDSLYDGMPLD